MKVKKIMLSCISKPREIEEKCPRLAQKKESGFSVYSVLGQRNLEREDYLKLIQKVNNEDKIFITGIINNILQKKITLDDLNNLKELKKENKELFLEDLKLLVCDEALHELNQKIMEHALDLVDSKDLAFLLRLDNEYILRKLIYLEAKRDDFSAEIDKKGILKINFPSKIFELYKFLLNNFYLKKFENEELQKKLYQEFCPDCQITFEELIPFEKLIEKKELQKKLYQELFPDCQTPFEEVSFFKQFIECLKDFYIKNSLAQSIMCLLVSRDIREKAVSEELLKLDKFKQALESENFKGLRVLSNSSEEAKEQFNSTVVDYVLNDVKGVYIRNLASSNILELVNHTQPDNEIVSIEILGDSESPV